MQVQQPLGRRWVGPHYTALGAHFIVVLPPPRHYEVRRHMGQKAGRNVGSWASVVRVVNVIRERSTYAIQNSKNPLTKTIYSRETDICYTELKKPLDTDYVTRYICMVVSCVRTCYSPGCLPVGRNHSIVNVHLVTLR